VEWRDRLVTPQRQAGFSMVRIPTELGDISADALARLADVIEQYGEGQARGTQQQDLVLRWVHDSELAGLHRRLRELGMAEVRPAVLRNVVACAGAATCRLGICLSRGLAGAIRNTLASDGLDLDALGNLRIHISGCPNACGRHPIADIGFFGAARRVHGRLVPHYVLQLGGRVGADAAKLAQGQQAIPARNVPATVAGLLETFQQSAEYPDFQRFLEAQGPQFVDRLAAQHQTVPPFEEDKHAYIDWGASDEFSLAGRGPGECSAGVFDLIKADLASAQDASEQGRWYDAVVLASRSLLITRGEEARDGREALDLFRRHFVAEKLVDDALGELVAQARQAHDARTPQESFRANPQEVTRLIQAVQQLYDNMDSSLRFKPAVVPQAASQPPQEPPPATVHRQADFRGVTCPLNFVKTKLVLQQMRSGEVLSVLLDEPGSRNVPPSVEQEGHQVLSVDRDGDAWRLVVRKMK
jgi:sulfite reductase (ferredoxin)